jgi:hypothetical protein
MKIFHYLDAIFIKLSAIPGLGFLHDYVEELEIQQQRRRIAVDQFRGYGRSLREAGHAAKHGGHHGHEEHGEHSGHDSHNKHNKDAKRGGIAGHSARSEGAHDADEDPEDLEEDYYEDDDFESYLQH